MLVGENSGDEWC